jgi:hypothetical protein
MSLILDRRRCGDAGGEPSATTAAPDAAAALTSPRPRPLRELLLIVVLFTAYKLGRLAVDDVSAAFDNARLVWSLERVLHLPIESTVQHALLSSDVLVRGANSFYAYVHFPATAAFLLWAYLRRTACYLWARRTLAALTGAALVVHLLFPLAPPRMLSGLGLVDLAAVYGPSVYGPPETDTLANQYAAMPSLHVGWAVVVAVGLIAATRTRLRWLWLAHPALTMLVVVGTANHYWLDGVAACALLAVVFFVLGPPSVKAAGHAAGDLPRAAEKSWTSR